MDITVNAGDRGWAENRNGLHNAKNISVENVYPERDHADNVIIAFGGIHAPLWGVIGLSQEAMIELSKKVLEAYGYEVYGPGKRSELIADLMGILSGMLENYIPEDALAYEKASRLMANIMGMDEADWQSANDHYKEINQKLNDMEVK